MVEVNKMEIERVRVCLEDKIKKSTEETREKVRTVIVEKLVRRDYERVLELASSYRIQIPKEDLAKAAEYIASVSGDRIYSVRGEHKELVLAEQTYRRLGRNLDADAVKAEIEKRDLNAEINEFERTWK